MIKTIGYGIFFYLYLFRIIPHYFKIKKLELQGDKEKHIEAIRNITFKWGNVLLKMAKVKLNIKGLENIPSGPVLFVSNHQSNFDIPIYFAALDKQFGFIAKSDLSKIPLFNKWIAIIKSVYIDRGDARQSLKAIQEGIDLLKTGYSLVIFPEGTRSKSSKMSEFKKGSLRLATKSKVPVVPITLNGSYKILEENNRIQSASVDFIIHKPIETKNLSKEEANNLSETVYNIISNTLNDLLKEKQ
ncbi:MAG: 1-acyl-sn-glycerol-3-phosphate acyltransferase [Clostridia bacterium]|nr:1-acyl-sn-glycerol-3-phosphate acyltransferase [Clostridia bacterium]